MRNSLSLIVVALSVGWTLAGDLTSLSDNTWTRIADSPGDALGREVPPGRASTWIYAPNVGKFLRYGGYTPSFTNALDEYNPATKAWTRLFAHDETYPSTRPGGGSNWSIAYDSSRQVVYLAGGWRSGGYNPVNYAIGDQGIWKYDPAAKSFTKLGDNTLGFNTYFTFDPLHDVIVASPLAPSLDGKFANKTFVFNLKTNLWETRSTSPLPQSAYGGSYPAVFDASIGKVVLLQGSTTWTYDAGTNQWAQLTTTGTPPSERLPALAYDPDHQVVIRYGGSDGQYYSSAITQTWVFRGSTSTWTQVTAPGLPQLGNALLYCQAFTHDPVHHCMVLNDPDLGVWAFKYNPSAPAGTQVVDAAAMVVGGASKNPSAPGPADVFRNFDPLSFNSTLLAMNDRTLISLTTTASVGGEIMWDYDPDAGVIVKYGGCGNMSSPYWEHYGNQLDVLDPRTERWVPRRVGEVSGAERPSTGCTRSNIYDSKRKKWWFFGSASSGPYNPSPAGSIGPYHYDIATDKITDLKVSQTVDPNNPGCVMSYDPDHDVAIVPDAGKVYVFNFATTKWEQRTVTGGPGRLYAYNRTVYVPTLNSFFCVHNGKSWAYAPATNQWTDLNPSNPPPTRGSKPGLAYDSRNNVVLFVGGQVSWNTGPFNDMWIYHVQGNNWEEVTPASGTKPGDEIMCTAYDWRHNVFLMGNTGQTLYAYRYKKVAGVGDEAQGKGKKENGKGQIQISPNPVSGTATVRIFGAAASAPLRAAVYDLSGRRVALLPPSGFWDTRAVPAGVYVVKALAGGKVYESRVTLLK